MRFSATFTCVAVLVCTNSSLFGQTGNGYIGVFGDAAGTIRCMQAPAGVPITLYVVAKTTGASAGGITGAEFRVEFMNPTGYYIDYHAPQDALALGNPLDPVGINLAFPSCRAPTDSAVSLGTITVYNAGAGGQTDIVTKRRNPPSNANYSCALLVQCDAPVYTTTCATAPGDSSACVTQKSRGHVAAADDFRTFLDSSEEPQAPNYSYAGYKFLHCAGGIFDKATAQIELISPMAVVNRVSAWVGLDNNSDEGLESRAGMWIQAGWIKWTPPFSAQMFYEYKNDEGIVTPITTVGLAPADGNYGVMTVNSSIYVLTNNLFAQTLDVQHFDAQGVFATASHPLRAAAYVSEKLDTDDYFPGADPNVGGQPCRFTTALIRSVGESGNGHRPLFSTNNETPQKDANAGQNPHDGSFDIWDWRGAP